MDIELNGKKAKLSVSDAVFDAKYNQPLVHQVVTAFLAGGRAGTKAQKTRAMVRGGGAKPYRQKGTGQARAGTTRSPIWRTGGRTFAAVPRDFSQKVNRKMYRGALRAIVSELARQDRLVVAEKFSMDQIKTKELQAQLLKMGLTDVLIVTENIDQNLFLSARNLPRTEVCDVEALNPVALLARKKVLMTQDAIKKLEARLS